MTMRRLFVLRRILSILLPIVSIIGLLYTSTGNFLSSSSNVSDKPRAYPQPEKVKAELFSASLTRFIWSSSSSHAVTNETTTSTTNSSSSLEVTSTASTSTTSSTTTTTTSTIPPTEDYSDLKPACLNSSSYLWFNDRLPIDNFSTPKCSRILASIQNEDVAERDRLLVEAVAWENPLAQNDSTIYDLVSNCTSFLEKIQFPTKPASKEEAEYPLAYVFVAHRNAAQTVRLFRMLYQPQNAYCIVYDTKSDESYKNTVLSLASCFPSNVYINPEPEPVYYFGYSILRSVMNCMKVLGNSPIKWRYVQVVSWNDFPLRTNWEMVQIFKILNGSQDSDLEQMNTPQHFTFKFGTQGGQFRSIPPDSLKIYKGTFATSMTREFLNFMFNDPTAIRLYKWLFDAKAPEEFYWPTLIHNVQLKPPGGFPGECEPYYTTVGKKKPFLSRFELWVHGTDKDKCKGKFVNFSCLFGAMDLAMIMERFEFIVHKVYEEYQPALMYCLEEWYWRRVCDGQTGILKAYYRTLPSVRYHNLSEKDKENFVCNI